MLSRMWGSLRQRTEQVRSALRKGRNTTRRPASISGGSGSCRLFVLRARATACPEQNLHRRRPISSTAAWSSAPRACWRGVRLTRLTEATFDRLRDDVDILEWHVGIERQRDGAIADPFGNREIARLIAVAFGKVRHQMNGTIVDHGT